MKKAIICVLIIVQCYLTTAQTVGIGTTTPNASAQLDIVSTNKGLLIPRMTAAQRAAIASPAIGLMVYETTTNSLWLFNGTVWVQQSSGGVSPWAVSGDNIYNTNSRNVGIGTNTPSSKFSVAGNLLVTGGDISINDASATVFLRVSNSARASVALSGVNNDLSIGTLALNDLGKMYFKTQSVNRMTIEPNGDVGVGFTSPSYKLDVNGNARTVGNFIAEDGYIQIKSTTDSKLWNMQYSSGTGRLLFLESGVERVILQNGGNVGIGETFPAEKLHVNGNTMIDGDATLNTVNPTIQLQNSDVNKGFIQLSGDNIRIGTNSGNTVGKFVIRTNGGDRVFVDESGNVNIGSQTDAPGYKLRVDGKMICEEVKVKLSTAWPDYVFDDKHKLMTIGELSKFIRQNKHLPNIPSAKEIESNGMEVGDMQKRMMEKIEELTLYIISLQQQIDNLKKESR
ncbi:MAG: hypothetical protein IPN39_12960 [Chitinophagaceae bacterium]|nr:hypothetical protein [Chitinophagaceae bacterium]